MCRYNCYKEKHANTIDYFLNAANLSWKTVYKDLGVFIDQRRKFDHYIDHISCRSLKLIEFILWSCSTFTGVQCHSALFKSSVRPILEYNSVPWNPTYTTHINRLERVERKFFKYLYYHAHGYHLINLLTIFF